MREDSMEWNVDTGDLRNIKKMQCMRKRRTKTVKNKGNRRKLRET